MWRDGKDGWWTGPGLPADGGWQGWWDTLEPRWAVSRVPCAQHPAAQPSLGAAPGKADYLPQALPSPQLARSCWPPPLPRPPDLAVGISLHPTSIRSSNGSACSQPCIRQGAIPGCTTPLPSPPPTPLPRVRGRTQGRATSLGPAMPWDLNVVSSVPHSSPPSLPRPHAQLPQRRHGLH